MAVIPENAHAGDITHQEQTEHLVVEAGTLSRLVRGESVTTRIFGTNYALVAVTIEKEE